jgi:hypothetical protein
MSYATATIICTPSSSISISARGMQPRRSAMASRRRTRKHRASEGSLTDLLHKLVDQCDNPALLLQLCYWSHEKELAALMQNYLQLPEMSRRLLSAFLDMAKGDPVSVDVKVCQNGDIVLSSAVVSDMLKRINQKLDPVPQWPDEAKSVH